MQKLERFVRIENIKRLNFIVIPVKQMYSFCKFALTIYAGRVHELHFVICVMTKVPKVIIVCIDISTQSKQ